MAEHAKLAAEQKAAFQEDRRIREQEAQVPHCTAVAASVRDRQGRFSNTRMMVNICIISIPLQKSKPVMILGSRINDTFYHDSCCRETCEEKSVWLTHQLSGPIFIVSRTFPSVQLHVEAYKEKIARLEEAMRAQQDTNHRTMRDYFRLRHELRTKEEQALTEQTMAKERIDRLQYELDNFDNSAEIKAKAAHARMRIEHQEYTDQFRKQVRAAFAVVSENYLAICICRCCFTTRVDQL